MIADKPTTAPEYLNLGFCPVPIPFQQKAPKLDGWQSKRWNSPDELRPYFSQQCNIGIHLGEPSGWIVDIDLDHPLAVDLAPRFLPSTTAVFGRAGKPKSHYLYRVTKPTATKKFKTPKGDGRKTIVELRSTGCQTVVPGSVHPSGEAIEWESFGEPAAIDPETLLAQLQALSNEVHRQLGLTPEMHSTNGHGVHPAIIPTDATERARKYLAKIPPAVSGSGGHDQTFHAACVLIQGFCVERESAISLLSDWNQSCEPPWSERELIHKVDEAIKQPGERGYLLGDHRASAHRAHLKNNGKTADISMDLEPIGSISLNENTIVCNAVVIGEGEDQEVIPVAMKDIIDRIIQHTGGPPYRVGEILFVPVGQRVDWLTNSDHLFAYLHRAVGGVNWKTRSDCASKRELFAALLQTVKRYEAVEVYPHFPPRQNHFYLHPEIKPGDGTHLQKLVNRFCPATMLDGDLIKALFVTAFWGGDPGARPAFNVNAPQGRGMGKTTLVIMAGQLLDGVFDLQCDEKADAFKKRLLTPAAATKRIVLVDNIKTSRFSWAELEALITSYTISGHRMYFGEGMRPNTFLWAITMNGAALSKDLAQRCVTIKLGKPEYAGSWREETSAFIEAHRWEIIADVAAFFQQPAEPLAKVSRWGAWESAVLARLPEPSEAQAAILERQAEVNVDDEEHATIEDYFAQQLERLGYDIDADTIHLPNDVACQWYRAATQSTAGPTLVTRMVRQGADEGALKRLRVNPCRTHGRGLLWSVGPTTAVAYDLMERVRQYGETNSTRW